LASDEWGRRKRTGRGFRTPLYWEAGDGHVSIVRLLLEAGAAIDPRTNDGNIPLLWATHWEQCEAIKLLMTKRANAEVRDWTGKSTLERARNCGDFEIVELLQERNPNSGQKR
jgi:ankyrin repeat protein